jgi:hypothetical protein
MGKQNQPKKLPQQNGPCGGRKNQTLQKVENLDGVFFFHFV